MNDLYVCTNSFEVAGQTWYCGEVWMYGMLCHVTEPMESPREAREAAANFAIN